MPKNRNVTNLFLTPFLPQQELQANFTNIIGSLVKNSKDQRFRNAMRAASSPNAVLLLQMPTPEKVPMAANPLLVIKTGIKFRVKGKRIKSSIYFGHGSHQGRYFGVAVASSAGNRAEIRRPYQLFRMDWHNPHAGRKSSELGYWNSAVHHFHVLSKR